MTYLFFKNVVKLYKKQIDELAQKSQEIENTVYSHEHTDAVEEVNFILGKNATLAKIDKQRLNMLEAFYAETMEYYENFLVEEESVNRKEARFGKKLSEIIFTYERDADMSPMGTKARIESVPKKPSSISERIKNCIINYLRK